MNNSFLKAYEKQCSKEVFAKAKAWSEAACKSSSKKLFLNKGHSYRRKEFFTHTEHKSEAYDLLLMLDIHLRCLGVLTSAMLEGLSLESTEAEANSQRALLSLCSYLYQTTSTIQREVIQQNDLSSRIIARSIGEASDYLLAMLYDQELVDEYVTSNENFHVLWTKKLRSKEISKLRRRALEKIFQEDKSIINEVSDYVKQELEVTSRAAHPSYEAGLLHFLFMAKSAADDPEWGFMSRWAHSRVIRFVLSHSTLPISMICIGTLDDNSSELLKIPVKKESFFGVDTNAIEAILHAMVLGNAFAARHAHQFT